MINYILVFLWGIAIGCNFMAWWKDRNNGKIYSGKVTALKPWPGPKIIPRKVSDDL